MIYHDITAVLLCVISEYGALKITLMAQFGNLYPILKLNNKNEVIVY